MHKLVYDFLGYLKNERNVSPHTTRSYRSDLDQFFEFLGEKDIAAIDHQTLRQFMALLLKAHDPKFKDKVSAEFTGPGGVPLSITVEFVAPKKETDGDKG